MSACSFADFDIFIQGDAPTYHVTASYGGQHAVGTIAASMLDANWHAHHQTLNASLTYSDESGIEAVGTQLWNALMQDKVRDLWLEARFDWQQDRIEGIRLRLEMLPVEVAALPWEALRAPSTGVVFAAHPDFALVRVASLAGHLGPNRRQQVRLPVRILIAAPDDPGGQIDATAEIAGIRTTLGEYGRNRVEIEELRGQISITELGERITAFKPTILHFIGHGQPNGLWMWQGKKERLASAASLAGMLARTRSVKLAVLNTCLAAQPTGPQPFTGVAAKMLQTGLPAVVAMQYKVRDHAAILFAHFLYGELICGPCPGQIDVAVNRARNSLYVSDSGDFSFGTPILWLNSANGRIFNVDEQETAPEEIDLAPVHPKIQLDLTAERAWLAAVIEETDVEQLPLGYAFLRAKWNNLVAELEHILVQLADLTRQPDQPAYGEKVADYRRFKAALLRIKRLIEEAASAS